MGGTVEGTLHLWDLRESSAIHKDRDSTDLGIERGIRKPCYSTIPLTPDQGSSSGSSGGGGLDAMLNLDQHAAAITRVESIGDTGSGQSQSASASQFASLDQRGVVCLWVTAAKDSGVDNADAGLAPWGRVALVMTRTLNVDGGPGGVWSMYLDAPSALATVPGDVSTLLCAAQRGKLSKVVRFGSAPAPLELQRSEQGGGKFEMTSEFQPQLRGGQSSSGCHTVLHSDVTCIAVQKKASQSQSQSQDKNNKGENKNSEYDRAQLILVGRADGTVDLFRMDVSAPVHSWTFPFKGAEVDKSSSKTASIVSVRWLPNRFSSFAVVDSLGNCFLFDLLLDAHKPVTVENLKTDIRTQHTVSSRSQAATKDSEGCLQADLSAVRPGSSIAYMALNVNGKAFVRPIWDGW